MEGSNCARIVPTNMGPKEVVLPAPAAAGPGLIWQGERATEK